MFPQEAPILGSDMLPAAFERDEAGVEGVALRAAHDLLLAIAVERLEEPHHMGGDQGLDMGSNGRSRELGQRCDGTVVHLSAAAAEQQAEQVEEARAVRTLKSSRMSLA